MNTTDQQRFLTVVQFLTLIYGADNTTHSTVSLYQGIQNIVTTISPKNCVDWYNVGKDITRLLKVWQSRQESSVLAKEVAEQITEMLQDFNAKEEKLPVLHISESKIVHILPDTLYDDMEVLADSDSSPGAVADITATSKAEPTSGAGSYEHSNFVRETVTMPVISLPVEPVQVATVSVTESEEVEGEVVESDEEEVVVEEEEEIVVEVEETDEEEVAEEEEIVEEEEVEEVEEVEETEEVVEEVEETEEEVVEAEDVAEDEEEEEEAGMEVEQIYIRGRSYWLETNTKKIYAVVDGDDVGDEVGEMVGSKPQFYAK